MSWWARVQVVGVASIAFGVLLLFMNAPSPWANLLGVHQAKLWSPKVRPALRTVPFRVTLSYWYFWTVVFGR